MIVIDNSRGRLRGCIKNEKMSLQQPKVLLSHPIAKVDWKNLLPNQHRYTRTQPTNHVSSASVTQCHTFSRAGRACLHGPHGPARCFREILGGCALKIPKQWTPHPSTTIDQNQASQHPKWNDCLEKTAPWRCPDFDPFWETPKFRYLRPLANSHFEEGQEHDDFLGVHPFTTFCGQLHAAAKTPRSGPVACD